MLKSGTKNRVPGLGNSSKHCYFVIIPWDQYKTAETDRINQINFVVLETIVFCNAK